MRWGWCPCVAGDSGALDSVVELLSSEFANADFSGDHVRGMVEARHVQRAALRVSCNWHPSCRFPSLVGLPMGACRGRYKYRYNLNTFYIAEV